MIVRQQPDGSLVLITQNDHAKLSGVLAAHWGNERFQSPRPLESVVRGTVFHDCGWLRYDTGPIYNVETQTTPTFFQVPNSTAQLKAFQWGIDWLSGIDAYAGLMISRHRTGLWRNRYDVLFHPRMAGGRSASDDIQAFLARNEPRQEEALRAFNSQEFEINFRLLQVWDLLSLYFCMADPKDEYIDPVPVSYDPEAATVRIDLKPAGTQQVIIDPYPFDMHPMPVEIVCRYLPHHRFESEAAFRVAYFGALFQIKRFEFIRA